MNTIKIVTFQSEPKPINYADYLSLYVSKMDIIMDGVNLWTQKIRDEYKRNVVLFYVRTIIVKIIYNKQIPTYMILKKTTRTNNL
jgi:hypothetical protein